MQKAKIKVTYGGIVVETEGYKCPKCGEEFLTIEQAKKSRRKLAAKRAALAHPFFVGDRFYS